MPIGVPSSRPRSVSMTGVNGWYSANQRSPAGIESVGTKPLPRNGSSIRNIGMLLAVSTLLLTMPSATDSQVSARVIRARTPTAASHPPGRRWAESRSSRATPMTTAMLSIVWIMRRGRDR